LAVASIYWPSSGFKLDRPALKISSVESKFTAITELREP
jgi:hypothetical protein